MRGGEGKEKSNFAAETLLLNVSCCLFVFSLSLPRFARSLGLAIIASLSDSPDLTKSSNLAKQKVVKEVG